MKNIILCGFMGCGKTTVGKAIAQALHIAFIDMDAYIEHKTGLSVADLFSQYGEDYFRRLEADAAAELSRRDNLVLSTGGGTVLNPDNAAALKSGGVIVYLEVPVEIIMRRLAGDTTRPLLNRPDKDAALLVLYRARTPAYRAVSDVTVANDTNLPASEIADRIIRAVCTPPGA